MLLEYDYIGIHLLYLVYLLSCILYQFLYCIPFVRLCIAEI